MKKSNFLALVLGTVAVVLFALGMCMTLLPEWHAFRPGVVLGCAGLALGLFTVLLWRKLDRNLPVHLGGKALPTILVSALGALALGVGMCLCMVWSHLVPGVVVGLAGIVILLMLIPMRKGLV